MAAKIKLGNRPKNFKKVVTFPMLDGTTGAIEVTYKYRTRTEFGLFIDEFAEAAKKRAEEEKKQAEAAESDAEAAKEFSLLELMDKTAGANAEYVLKVIDGWNLDEELNHANVQQLADELPAAVNAIMSDYQVAITQGRLGN